MELPLRPGSFAFVHSSGVLHHTPSTERAFASILPAVRAGGRVYVQLYRRREAWVGIPNAVLRSLTSRLPPRLLYRICWAAVPLHTMLVRLVARLRGENSPIASASRGERALSLFDNFSPRYQYRYTPEQMRQMFEAAGLIEIQDTTLANEARHMVAFVGRRPSEGARTHARSASDHPVLAPAFASPNQSA
jgi:SAM-dependent methyltransferase